MFCSLVWARYSSKEMNLSEEMAKDLSVVKTNIKKIKNNLKNFILIFVKTYGFVAHLNSWIAASAGCATPLRNDGVENFGKKLKTPSLRMGFSLDAANQKVRKFLALNKPD